MLNVIPSEQRHHADFGWLDTKWHFSFADYYDPKNMNFGPLRVFNDDVIAPGGGFDTHPHRNMEIVTYVLDGVLAHEDSMGNREFLRAGEVQVMSAGSGLTHSEFNGSTEESVHLVQLWLQPRRQGASPRWEQRRFPPTERLNRLLPVVSAGNVPGTLAIDQDAVIYVSTLESTRSVTHTTAPGRRIYLFVAAGEVLANEETLRTGDQARIEGVSDLQIKATRNAELVLLDLP